MCECNVSGAKMPKGEKVILTIRANYTDNNNNFYPLEVLLKAWKNSIGESTVIENQDFVVLSVNESEDGKFIFVESAII